MGRTATRLTYMIEYRYASRKRERRFHVRYFDDNRQFVGIRVYTAETKEGAISRAKQLDSMLTEHEASQFEILEIYVDRV